MKYKNDLKECTILGYENGTGEVRMVMEYKGRTFTVFITAVLEVRMFLPMTAMYNGDNKENIPVNVAEFYDDVMNTSKFAGSFNLIETELLPTPMELGGDLTFMIIEDEDADEHLIEFKNVTVRITDIMGLGKIEVIANEGYEQS